ncbi:hypothetical protein LTR37_000499 [Vermiconidia calcicola]|uniref:Uncharacterized protein n=1 Tax=Vermiconidia calcicola TaxID=1690605 RepID=A0ACC3NYP7_9PEZI|nr:hypothetical protein LTR37_000499 [Vermiconidia calcicola]
MALLSKDADAMSSEQQITITANGLTVNLPFDIVKDMGNQRSEQELERLKRHITYLQNRNTLLLRLPAELRNYIYELVIRDRLQNRDKHPWQPTLAQCVKPPLLSTSQQLRYEGQRLYFGKFMTTERYDRSRNEWRTLPAEEASRLALCPIKLPRVLYRHLNHWPLVKQWVVRDAYQAYLVYPAGKLPPVGDLGVVGYLWAEHKASGNYNR